MADKCCHETSKDYGRTWSDSVCVARGNEHAKDTVQTAYGDPSLVADRTSDNVLMHCVAGKVAFQSQHGAIHSMPSSSIALIMDVHGIQELT